MRLAKIILGLTLLPGPAPLVPAQQPPLPPAPLQQRTSNPADTEAALREATRRNPQSFEAHYALGAFLAGHGTLAEAIAHLEQASRLQPGHYACGYDLALAWFKTGRLAEAAQKARELLARNNTAELHNLLGAVEEAAGNIDTAAKELQQAAEMDPTEKHVFDFGNVLLRYRAYDGALKILRYGVERYPRAARLKVAYGVALYSLARYDEAVETLCTAVDLDSTDSRALHFLGKMRDISPAMAVEVTRRLQNFARLYPQNASANYFYATSLWKASGQESEADLDEVERLLQKAVILDPRFHEAHFELGTLYERLGRDEDAIRHYQRAAQLNPDLDTPHYRLARLFQRRGQTEPARQAIQTYERLHKQSQSEKEATQPPALIVK